ncbi:MAG: DUF3734 domain-containing protein [Acetobacteraceae bacterium]
MRALKTRAGKSYRKSCALVLQGGGALGSYQAGVYEALAAGGYMPDWVAGISIGAINAALIAGNPQERRVSALRAFWDEITKPSAGWPRMDSDPWRLLRQRFGAANSLLFGQPGFFQPRPGLEWMLGESPISYYDTMALRHSLERLVDFDRINDHSGSGHMRLSVGAVDIATGNFAYFDSAHQRILPEHVMASGALPPGFPPVEIEGAQYWDGGLVSNTPLQYVLDSVPRTDTLAFQVDVFPARGPVPKNLDEVAEREKDIRFSSRTRAGTDSFREKHQLRRMINAVLAKLPPELKTDPDVLALADKSCTTTMDVVHLIYHPEEPQGAYKDFEFSRPTMLERWAAGKADAEAALAAEPWLEDHGAHVGLRAFDPHRAARERR